MLVNADTLELAMRHTTEELPGQMVAVGNFLRQLGYSLYSSGAPARLRRLSPILRLPPMLKFRFYRTDNGSRVGYRAAPREPAPGRTSTLQASTA